MLSFSKKNMISILERSYKDGREGFIELADSYAQHQFSLAMAGDRIFGSGLSLDRKVFEKLVSDTYKEGVVCNSEEHMEEFVASILEEKLKSREILTDYLLYDEKYKSITSKFEKHFASVFYNAEGNSNYYYIGT